jgi:AraC-like DNA-binding protein
LPGLKLESGRDHGMTEDALGRIASAGAGELRMDYRVAMAKTLLEQWKHRNDSLKDVAKHLRMSRSHLRHLFRKNIGMPPKKYLKLVRLQSARDLIGGTLLSIKEVAVKVGYCDSSHFVRDFKVQYGVTPTQIRVLPKNRIRQGTDGFEVAGDSA